jgi:hypothetical protein
MSNIAITIMTVARPGDYLDRTLASLAPVRPITLMVGAPETGSLDRYRGNPFIKILSPSPEDFAFLEAEDVGRRAAWNYWRCLGEGAGESRLLIFEDDVIFAAGWEARIARIVEQIERSHADYVVSLYYPYPPEESPSGSIDYPKGKFYGTQGVLFAGRARAEFRKFLRDRGVERWTLPYDLLLQRYTIDADIPLFATMPSLVQHIGAVTTGQSGHFHTTNCFVDDLGRPAQDADARRR